MVGQYKQWYEELRRIRKELRVLDDRMKDVLDEMRMGLDE